MGIMGVYLRGLSRLVDELYDHELTGNELMIYI